MADHADLVTRAELPQFGVAPEFLEQFTVRPIQVQIVTAGALGTMTAKWRPLGETVYSETVASSSLGPWSWSPAQSSAVIAFASGVYVASSIYTIDEAGTVTISGGGIATVTASRYDLVAKSITSQTQKAVDLMQPRITPPLTAWGSGIKNAVASMVLYDLKSAVGLASGSAAVGDDNIRLRYMDAVDYLQRIGRGDRKPPDVADSSSGGAGAGLMVAVASDDLAGW